MKVKVKKEGKLKTYKIVDSWKDVTLEKWQQLTLGKKKSKTKEAKHKMIELHNTIYNTGFKTNSNCNSCLSQCYNGIKNIYEKIRKK